MTEVEEVYLDESEQYAQTEFVTTEEVKPVPVPIRRVRIIPAPQRTVVQRKVPIVRLAGEVVTPVQFRSAGNTPVAQPVHLTAAKIDWSPRHPLQVKTTLTQPLVKRIPMNIKPVKKFENFSKNEQDSDNEVDVPVHTVESSQNSHTGSSQDRLGRIENKLDMILAKLNQHDAALKLLKMNIKDLRVEVKNGSKRAAENAAYDSPRSAPKRVMKRLVVFPVPDDSYLARLEELVQTDDDIRAEVVMLYNDAATTSVYDFVRRNISQLFENCSKHTWTGKPPQNMGGNQPGANCASKLQLVEMMLNCCWDHFASSTRDYIQKEFRRALTNFNDARNCRMVRRMQKEGVLVEESMTELEETA